MTEHPTARKLQEIGGSLGITLPSAWISKMKLEAGSLLFIRQDGKDLKVSVKQ